jgi:hypothetical protein
LHDSHVHFVEAVIGPIQIQAVRFASRPTMTPKTVGNTNLTLTAIATITKPAQ